MFADRWNVVRLLEDLKYTKWRLKSVILAAKDRNLHPVAILNSTARTTRWTGTASEKNAQFLREKFEK